jgi:cob(I)alamin adenosyltransferase
VAALEAAIDALDAALPPLRNFILPAGSRGAALLHVARGVCRRAERRVVTLAAAPETRVSEALVRYLNRLGDYLFVAARYANQAAGQDETTWQRPAP